MPISDRNDLDYNDLYRFIIVGGKHVGKSTLGRQYAQCASEPYSQVHEVNGKRVKTQVYDNYDEESYAMAAGSMRGVHAVILMCDVTNRASFENLAHHLAIIEDQAPENVKIIVVGNKFDAPNRAVTKQEIENFARDRNFPCVECSALGNSNVELVFETAVNSVLNSQSAGANLQDKQKELLELIHTISADRALWAGKVRFGGVTKTPAGARDFLAMDSLDTIVDHAKDKHSGRYLFRLHQFFRGRDRVTNDFYGIIKNVNVDDVASINDAIDRLNTLKELNSPSIQLN